MKITLAMCLLLGVGYVLVLRGVSALAGPNGGQAETLTLDGRVVGAANVGQQFTGGRYFWGRPSAVDYNGGGSGGSNKATTNPEYLADVEQRVQDFLAAHPYLSRGEVPSEMVTASGSGLDPDISPRGAQVQVRRVAAARGLDEAVVQRLVDSLTQKTVAGAFRHGEGQRPAPEYRAGNPATERHGLGRCPAGRRVRGGCIPGKLMETT